MRKCSPSCATMSCPRAGTLRGVSSREMRARLTACRQRAWSPGTDGCLGASSYNVPCRITRTQERRHMKSLTLFFAGIIMATLTPTVRADEGMWLFNNPPKKLLHDKYGFDVTPEWLEHVQKSSVRFNS